MRSLSTEANTFRLHQAIQLLVMIQFSFEAVSLRHNRISNRNSNGTFMHPND